MTQLQAQATAYAADICYHLRLSDVDYDLVLNLVRDAYEQGWVDCDTKGEVPESQDEYFDQSSDCRWFNEGYCSKALPGTDCERSKCVAYLKRVDNE